MRRIGIAVGILAVVGCIAAVIVLSNSSASGTVVTRIPGKSVVKTDSYLTLSGQYISLSYRATYGQSDSSLIDKTALEQHKLLAGTAYNKEMTITVRSLPSGNVDDDSSYHMRSIAPETYHAQVQTLENEQGKASIFIKDDGSEATAFIPHDGKELTIGLITAGQTQGDNLQTELTAIVKSVEWRK